MPTVTLNKDVFEMLVGKKLPLEKLKDRISMLGTDLESIEENKITVEVFPNRPDMLSEQGFARAFSSFIGVKTGFKTFNVSRLKEKVYINNLPREWPYAVACVVKNLMLDDEKIREIIQLQEKLGTTLTRNRKKGGLGLYPLEKISFPIIFTGKSPEEIRFKPLEFSEVIDAKQILSRHPKGREYGDIMKNWKTYPVFIDSKGVIMSMPPIINSHDVGKIDETTTEVFIEGTGPDLNTLKISLAILATSLADMGGKIFSLEMVYKDKSFEFPDLSPRKLSIDIRYINKMLGLDLKEKEIKNLLERMGFGYEKGKVLVPAYRSDILHQIDFAEDIAIAYGYENFKEEIPNVMTIAQGSHFEGFKEKIAEILIGLGLIEVSTNHITSNDKQKNMMDTDIGIIDLSNSVSVDHHSLRSWIIPNLLEVLSNNKHNEYPQNIFNIGVVFKEDSSQETNVKETTRVAVALCNEKADFTQIKQILEYLFNMLDLKYDIDETDHNSFIPGRVGRVKCEGIKVAFIGEIHPKVLGNWQLEYPVACFELNLNEVFDLISKNKKG